MRVSGSAEEPPAKEPFVSFSFIKQFRSYGSDPVRRRRHTPKVRSSDADAAWRECLDRDIYGANTADYSLQARRSARRSSAPEQPNPNRH
jgi:hypothetical protein